MPVPVMPQPVPQLQMHLGGYVSQVNPNQYEGYIRDEGNCWHQIDVDLTNNVITIHYKDNWWGRGCPDAKVSSDLPEEGQIDIGPVKTFPDGNVSGLYVEGPGCLENWDYGSFAIIPQTDGTDIMVMNGLRSVLKVCKP